MYPLIGPIDSNEFIFPLIGLKSINDALKLKNIYGTLSYVKNGFFVTAGHSITNSLECDKIAVGFQNPDNIKEWKYEIIDDHELFDEIDIGIVHVGKIYKIFKSFKIRSIILPLLSDIYTLGFPHAIEIYDQKHVIKRRALKGYIVNAGIFRQLNINFQSYEISFFCPKGISGAPILSRLNNGNILINGYIIGSSNIETPVFEEKEVLNEGNEKTVHLKTETTKFGIAINAMELLKINSYIFQKSIRDYLIENELLEGVDN